MNDLLGIINPPNWEVLIPLVIQVMIISYVMLWSWQRIIGSAAERIVKGVLVIAAVWGLAYLFRLTLITSLLHTFVPVVLIALIIIFQPELRRGLSHLGRMQSLKVDWSLTDAEFEKTKREVDQIVSAVRELSRSKTGALIVIEPSQGERDYVSPGTTVNADISTTLLLSIFFPNSPLHDGAVVIRQEKILAAGVILPMTDDPQLNYRYGTRHRAAIGLSETYDGLCIVVSEETGAISAASRGMLARYKAADDLREPILYLYNQGGVSTSPNPMSNFLSLFNMGRRDPVVISKTATDDVHASGSDRPGEKDQRITVPRLERVVVEPIVVIEPEKKRRTAPERADDERKLLEGERKAERARRKSADTHDQLKPVAPQAVESGANSSSEKSEEKRSSGSKSEDEIDDFLSHLGSVK
ncbi:MAG: diadenylate cyclase CdaA [Candidatus Melainabacteria bacterium]|nr:diadenylate cyclase CdaA [Candidatus Melainabacteria bacterium]